MQEISKYLASVERYGEKYLERVKSALSPAEKDCLREAVSVADAMIRRITEYSKKTSLSLVEIASVYDEIETNVVPLLTRAGSVIGDFSIVIRAGIGLTTSDEVELQNIANNALGAVRAVISADIRTLAIADSREHDDSSVLRWILSSEDDLRSFAAIIVADRGLGNKINPSRFEAAKNRALGVSEPTKRAPVALIAIPPLTQPDTYEVFRVSAGDAPIIVVERSAGSTMRSNYDVLLKNEKHQPFSGLNAALLKRYETIVVGSDRVSIHHVMTNSVATNRYIVVETNDGVTFAAWNGGNPINGDNIPDLVGHGRYDRCAASHAIMEPVIVDRMFDPMADSIIQRYASDQGGSSGDAAADYAKNAVYRYMFDMIVHEIDKSQPRAAYMKVVLDRKGKVQAILRSYPQKPQSLRESLERETSAAKFAMSIEKLAHAKSPTEKEFSNSTDHKRLIEIALTATLDAATVDTKRTKTFKFSGKNMAEFVYA